MTLSRRHAALAATATMTAALTAAVGVAVSSTAPVDSSPRPVTPAGASVQGGAAAPAAAAPTPSPTPSPTPKPTTKPAPLGYKHYMTNTAGQPSVPTRWNSCDGDITWRINLGGYATAKQRTLVLASAKESVARWSKATGLKYTYAGTTTYVPQPGKELTQPADLVMSFVTPKQTKYKFNGMQGLGGFIYQYRTANQGKTWRPFVTRGYILVDRVSTARWSRSTTAKGVTMTGLLMHEVGHTLGLDHVEDKKQIMNTYMGTWTPAALGAGDLAGAAKVGAPAGC